LEIISSLHFFISGKPNTQSPKEGRKVEFGEAFGVTTSRQPIPVREMPLPELPVQSQYRQEEEAILLRPYPFNPAFNPSGDV
jgi:hypothetical protein